MRHALGAFAAPAHTGPVEPKPDEVADDAFHGTRADIQISVAQRMIAHPVLVLGEVLVDLEQPLALALVAGSGLRDGASCLLEGIEHCTGATTAQQLGLLRRPARLATSL